MPIKDINTLEVKSTDLFYDVSWGLRDLVERYSIDYTKAELYFMREKVIQMLQNVGISQDTYDPNEHHFTACEAEYIVLNEMYNTNHSFRDISPK